MRLSGKTAIITGAAGGMGEAAALLFAREGAKVAAVDLKEARVAPVLDAIRAAGGTAIAIGADISRTADVQRIVDRTVGELGLPNILFNNAGVDTENKQSILDISEAAFDRCVEVNVKGVWLMIKHVAPRMIEAGGGSMLRHLRSFCLAFDTNFGPAPNRCLTRIDQLFMRIGPFAPLS